MMKHEQQTSKPERNRIFFSGNNFSRLNLYKRFLLLLALVIILSGCIAAGPTVSKSDMGNLELNVYTLDKDANGCLSDVYVDTIFIGNISSNRPILNLREGEHNIRIEQKGHKIYEKKIFIAGEPNHQVLNVLLEKN